MLTLVFAFTHDLAKAQIVHKLNWAEFLARHNLKWDSLSTDWYSGAFLGNGQLGAMIYKENDTALRWDIGSSEVTDNRDDMDVEWGKARLPIGKFLLKCRGTILNSSMELDLWNAEAKGLIVSDMGTISWRSFVANNPDVIVVEISETENERANWEWVPEEAKSPRLLWDKKPNMYSPWLKGEYLNNPQPRQESKNGVATYHQPLLVVGGFATSWKMIGEKSNRTKTVFVSVGYSNSQNSYADQAVKQVLEAEDIGVKVLEKKHRYWWHNYYPESFLSIPDTRLEGFYWIQQYKIASATRQDKMALDLMGPWYNKTPWPALWWNLNIQLNYYPVYASNRLHLGESLCNTLDANIQNLINNVPEKYRYNSAGISRISGYDCMAPLDLENTKLHQRFKEVGNLTWIMHNYWMQCSYAGDEKRMQENVYPLLKRSINYYLHILQRGTNGKLHLPPTYSPEYTGNIYPDCNYDLSLLRWGCKTLLNLNKLFSLNDTLVPKWEEVLCDLVAYPKDDTTGLHIGYNRPLSESHRHYSHLLMIYPLRTLKPDTKNNKQLIETSLAHWTGLKGALQGYTYTGAASISALLGNGNDAIGFLNGLLDNYIQPNTFYREAGPVIETPLSAVASVNEMALQSMDGEIHVFPAVPDAWQDFVFQDLRTEGAFLISAKREKGKTTYVKIKSLKGGTFKLKIGSPLDHYHIEKRKKGTIVKRINNFWEISLPKDHTVKFHSGNLAQDSLLNPVFPQKEMLNYYGSSKN